jgi:hypothetical protein
MPATHGLQQQELLLDGTLAVITTAPAAAPLPALLQQT